MHTTSCCCNFGHKKPQFLSAALVAVVVALITFQVSTKSRALKMSDCKSLLQWFIYLFIYLVTSI